MIAYRYVPLLGTVVVGNVSSQHKKNVFVRCTYNDWNSFLDIPAGLLLDNVILSQTARFPNAFLAATKNVMVVDVNLPFFLDRPPVER